MNARLRAALAGLCLALLVAGIPASLAATVGNPTSGWSALLDGEVSDAVVTDALATVAYLAWAQFAIAVSVETISTLIHRPTPRGIPPVFGSQHLAHALVAAFLMTPSVAPATPTHTPPPAAAVVATVTVPVRATPPSAAAHQHPDTVMRVVRRDGPGTYWNLAETYLGNGQRWPDIWHLNRGRHQDDGAIMTSPGLLRPGWTVLIPAPATEASARPADEAVVVRRGDTLSEIAADHYLSGWSGLWHLNRGRAQPDGKRFTDPDHIEPWIASFFPDLGPT
jgi:nucleoid-associated protein YgaU